MNSMLSMPTPTTANPNRSSHVPALEPSSRTQRAMSLALAGSCEMRYSSDSELTATMNDCTNSERICARAPGSSNEYDITLAGR